MAMAPLPSRVTLGRSLASPSLSKGCYEITGLKRVDTIWLPGALGAPADASPVCVRSSKPVCLCGSHRPPCLP